MSTELVAEYLDRIAAISPAISGRTAEAEELRRVPTENIKELGEAGLFRVFQPQRFGGPELSMADVLPMITQTAMACPSSSWVMAVLQIHQWILGLSPEQTQDEVWGDDPEALLCGVLQPRAMAKRVEGGYELGAAVWPYASGCDFASWAHVGGLVQNDNGPPDATVFLLPAKDFEIIDDWHVVGLRGTGSKSLSMKGTFVPAHRGFKLADAIAGKLGEGRSTLYQSAILPMLCLNITGTALGVARTTIETFITHIEKRNLPFSMDKQVDSPQTHELLAEVMLMVDSAELLLDKGGALVRDYAEAREQMPVIERSQVRVYSSAAVRQCVTAIDVMFAASGGSALQENNPLYKLSMNARAVAAHAALAHENNLQLWGAARLGKPLNSPMI
ncbi:MAG: 3-hydroxy-9,10-secoandrosta-1,3,5(10)-triene-9,17-dione monooxygenase [Gammaproteobacteria bacterium]|jgi:3-hydroxy-9,10-secoandrosta-1,3,5(10)-triene-9,17-dione monooxygenase